MEVQDEPTPPTSHSGIVVKMKQPDLPASSAPPSVNAPLPPPFSGEFQNLSTRNMQIAAQAAAIATAMHQMQAIPGSSMAPGQSAELAAKLIGIMQGTAGALSAGLEGISEPQPQPLPTSDSPSDVDLTVTYENHPNDRISERNNRERSYDGESRKSRRSYDRDREERSRSRSGSLGREEEMKSASPERNRRNRERKLSDEPPSKRLRDSEERGRKARARSPSRYHNRIEASKRHNSKEQRQATDGDLREQIESKRRNDRANLHSGKEKMSSRGVEEKELNKMKEFDLLKDRLQDVQVKQERTGFLDEEILTGIMAEIRDKAKYGKISKDSNDQLLRDIHHIRAEARHVQEQRPVFNKPWPTKKNASSRNDSSHEMQHSDDMETFNRPGFSNEQYAERYDQDWHEPNEPNHHGNSHHERPPVEHNEYKGAFNEQYDGNIPSHIRDVQSRNSPDSPCYEHIGPRPPSNMDGPMPPHMMGGPRPRHNMDSPRPPHMMDGPRPPHMMDGPRPRHNMDGPRPPHIIDGPRPSQIMDGPRSRPHIMDGPRPRHNMDGPRPNHNLVGPRPHQMLDGPRGARMPRPPSNLGGPRPPNVRMDGPRSHVPRANRMDGPPPHRMDGPRPPGPRQPHYLEGPRPRHNTDTSLRPPHHMADGPRGPHHRPVNLEQGRPRHLHPVPPLRPRMDHQQQPPMEVSRPSTGLHPPHMPRLQLQPQQIENPQNLPQPQPQPPHHSGETLGPRPLQQPQELQPFQIPKTSFHSTLEATTTPPSSRQPFDVSGLLGQLSAAGLMPTFQQDEFEQVPVQKIEIPKIRLTLEDLRVRNVNVIGSLIVGKQCSSCGERFPQEVHSEHLDWHFRQNRKDKRGVTKDCRKWYFDLKDWVEQDTKRVKDELLNQAQMAETEELTNSNKADNTAAKSKVEVSETEQPEDDSISVVESGEACWVCTEQLDTYWDEEREEWRYSITKITKNCP